MSMATSGIAAWNYREIDLLTQDGVEIYAFPLKWTEGPYMPKPEWHFHKPNARKSLAIQPIAFFSSPGLYFQLLKIALRTHTLVEFMLAWDYSRELKAQKVQHIHCHFGDRKFFTGYYCAKILGLPYSVTVHAYEILCNPNPEMFMIAAKDCKRIVVQSDFNKREVMRVFGIPEEKFSIIRAHGDMSDERMRTSVKLLMVAEFREKKGHEILFKALKKLGREDITVWIVGKGKLDVPQLAKDIGVNDQVVFLGEVGKNLINILYDACDVFVLPSRTAENGDREGIPAVLMEAMSHHKPIISTRHAGIPELVPEILCDENDVDGLAAAIATLIDNPARRIEMGERNYHIIKDQFSDAAVLELRKIYEVE